MGRIADIPIRDRPREKLARNGPATLSDRELLAIALGSGNKQDDVLTLSERILAVIDEKNGGLRIDDLTQIKGVGTARAALISAMLEFSRRRIRPEGVRIKSASDVIPLVKHLCDRKQEHFVCVSLNGAHEVIASRIVTVGLVNAAQVHPREVYSDPITDRACAVIVAHNHPSGELTPSSEDSEVTRRLKQAGDTLGIKLLDHIVFSHRGFLSFREQGLLGG